MSRKSLAPRSGVVARSTSTLPARSIDWRSLILSVGVSAGVLVAITLVPAMSGLRSAEVALTAGDFRFALLQAEQELRSHPNSSQALLIAGFAAQGLRQPDVATRYLARVPDEGNANSVSALAALATHALSQGRANDAERLLRRVIELDPNHADASDRLIFLLVLEGRKREAHEVVFRVLQSGRVDWNQLIVAGSNKTELNDSGAFAKSCLIAVPHDPLPLLPEAQQLFRLHNAQQARTLAERIVASRPEVLESQGLLGTILADTGDEMGFAQWNERLPHSADDDSGVWYARGVWAMKTGQSEGAARCFAEAVLRQPNLVSANHQLSQALAALHREELAAELGDRAKTLARLDIIVRQLTTPPDVAQIHEVVQLMESLGRHWEAAAWCHVAAPHSGIESWPTETLLRLRHSLATSPSLTVDAFNPARKNNLTSYPLPVWNRSSAPRVSPATNDSRTHQVTFSDEASAAHLNFTYRNGAEGDLESMFEMDGGGVAILDYDDDGWPDIYLTQGGTLPLETKRTDTDMLFRNMGNGRFEPATVQANLGDVEYSQGVTFGDFNNDGFPDLYVANIGPNALYRNNGDGTFTDVTTESGAAGNEWTSSCVLADINGDSLPDIFAVNYLVIDAVRKRVCRRDSANRCAPDEFSPEQDRLYLNLGDGRFEDVTRSAGIVDVDGRGLGVVAADFDDSHRISLFVGNDMSRNFLFANQTTSRGSAPRFLERALLQGVAVDSRGIPKASMGIAAGDANGDGLIDLFITNFYRESNNLYVQQPDHSFADATRAANLSESGVYMLGWGTQFLDGELDGLPDLIATNGHVHHPSDPRVPHRMPPQYFSNVGGGRFVEASAATLGEYFQSKHLGRSLARLDWNRDGLEEACISHLDTPAALLLNRTPQHGHFLAIKLVGGSQDNEPNRMSDRDAIGATLRVVASEREWQRQLTAGDGYQSANQRQLLFGLGQSDRIDRVDVTWPSGNRQTFDDVEVDREYVVIEGRSRAVAITR